MTFKKLLLLISFLLLTSCISKEPAELTLHTEECAHCKMVVSDGQFASQLVNSKGKSYMFDSVECMAAYTLQNSNQLLNANMYVSDFQNPGKWIKVDRAAFYKSSEIKSPMGMSLLALPKNKDPLEVVENYEQLTWTQVQDLIDSKWNDK